MQNNINTDQPHGGHNELRFTTIPNFLTLFRILLIPLLIYLLFLRDPFWDLTAAWIFALASITDFFDGYVARSQKLVTIYGKLMDPLADKFLIVSALVVLQHLGRIHPIVVILLICRELGITGLRAIASAEGVVIAASTIAKWKTTAQMFAIGFLMVKPGRWGIPFFAIGEVLLYLSLAISLFSATTYIIDFFTELKQRRLHGVTKRKQKNIEKKMARKARQNQRKQARLLKRKNRFGI